MVVAGEAHENRNQKLNREEHTHTHRDTHTHKTKAVRRLVKQQIKQKEALTQMPNRETQRRANLSMQRRQRRGRRNLWRYTSQPQKKKQTKQQKRRADEGKHAIHTCAHALLGGNRRKPSGWVGSVSSSDGGCDNSGSTQRSSYPYSEAHKQTRRDGRCEQAPANSHTRKNVKRRRRPPQRKRPK